MFRVELLGFRLQDLGFGAAWEVKASRIRTPPPPSLSPQGRCSVLDVTLWVLILSIASHSRLYVGQTLLESQDEDRIYERTRSCLLGMQKPSSFYAQKSESAFRKPVYYKL